MAKRKAKLPPKLNVCPECGASQGDARWPVLLLSSWPLYLSDFLFCTNCGWDSLFETRKMSREMYQYFWQRYRLMWGSHLRARHMTRGYHAPQVMVNFTRSFINPRWMDKHFSDAHSWLRWGKNFHEVRFPNRSLFDFYEAKERNPKVTMTDYVKLRAEWAAAVETWDYDDSSEYDY